MNYMFRRKTSTTLMADGGLGDMPRIPSLPNTLEYIGIGSISLTIVQLHKADKISSYRRDQTVWWYQTVHPTAAGAITPGALRAWLIERVRDAQLAPDDPATPDAVLTLATMVARQIKGARFGVDYFRDHRILTVGYSDCLNRWRTEYLSVWDNTGVIAIADTPKPRGFWQRLFNRGVSR